MEPIKKHSSWLKDRLKVAAVLNLLSLVYKFENTLCFGVCLFPDGRGFPFPMWNSEDFADFPLETLFVRFPIFFLINMLFWLFISLFAVPMYKAWGTKQSLIRITKDFKFYLLIILQIIVATVGHFTFKLVELPFVIGNLHRVDCATARIRMYTDCFSYRYDPVNIFVNILVYIITAFIVVNLTKKVRTSPMKTRP